MTRESRTGIRASGWWILILAAESALPAVTVWLTRRVAAEWAGGNPWTWAGALAGALAFAELVRTLRGWLAARQAARIRDAVTDQVHAKSASVGLTFHDDASFHERLHVARVMAPDQAVALVDGLGAIGQSAFALLLLGAMLAGVNPWMPLVIGLAMIPPLAARLHGARRLHAWRRRSQDSERRAWYLDYLLTCAEPAAELRVFGWSRRMRERFGGLRSELRESESAVQARNAIEQILALAAGAAICACAWPSVRAGAQNLPEALAIAQTCYYGFTLTQPLAASIGMVYSAWLTLANFREFLRLPDGRTIPGEPRRLRDGIRLRGVTFRYPGSARPVLENFDLFLAAGEITAITGPNGSGKSTLAKLLCGLYTPESGSIEFDGVPGPAAGQVSAMFQQPVRYQDTLAANIAPSDPAAPAGAVLGAATRAGLGSKIEAWRDPAAQLLGNQFPGGAELSGGEWQKVALARALYRDAPVLVLDEPTSMMDPGAESEFLANLRAHSRGRTVVMITHRETAARAADRIVDLRETGSRDFSQVI